MVQFTHYLLSNKVPEWGDKYIDYKFLKKILKPLRRRRAARHAEFAQSEMRTRHLSSISVRVLHDEESQLPPGPPPDVVAEPARLLTHHVDQMRAYPDLGSSAAVLFNANHGLIGGPEEPPLLQFGPEQQPSDEHPGEPSDEPASTVESEETHSTESKDSDIEEADELRKQAEREERNRRAGVYEHYPDESDSEADFSETENIMNRIAPFLADPDRSWVRLVPERVMRGDLGFVEEQFFAQLQAEFVKIDNFFVEQLQVFVQDTNRIIGQVNALREAKRRQKKHKISDLPMRKRLHFRWRAMSRVRRGGDTEEEEEQEINLTTDDSDLNEPDVEALVKPAGDERGGTRVQFESHDDHRHYGRSSSGQRIVYDDPEVEEELLLLTKAKRNKLRRKLAMACREIYRGLDLMRNYRILNFMGFVKILKKHDKVSDWPNASPVLAELLRRAPFYASPALEALVSRVETLFCDHLSETRKTGEKAAAMESLRSGAAPQVRVRRVVTFGIGWIFGVVTGLFVLLAVVLSVRPSLVTQDSVFRAHFPIFRGLLLVSLHFCGWAVNVGVWRRFRINHVFITESDVGSALVAWDAVMGPTSVFLLATIGISVLFAAMRAFDELHMDAHEWLTGPALLIGTLVLSMLPTRKHFMGPTRRYFWKRTLRVITAPLLAVKFTDFFLADQFTSQARAFQDLFYSCVFVVTSLSASKAKSAADSAAFVLGTAPYWFRLAQCLRRYWVTKRAFPHLANAGKYLASMVVTVLALFTKLSDDPALLEWRIALGVIATLYALTWDLVMDWGLLRNLRWWVRDELLEDQEGDWDSETTPERRRFFVRRQRSYYWALRAQLTYPAWFYYWAIASNALLRVSWVIGIKPEAFGLKSVDELFFLLLLGVLEVFRRVQWNVIRMENEHLNNCGEFRAVRAVPLLIDYDRIAFNVDEDDEDEDEDEDEEESEIRPVKRESVASLRDTAKDVVVLDLDKEKKKDATLELTALRRDASTASLSRMSARGRRHSITELPHVPSSANMSARSTTNKSVVAFLHTEPDGTLRLTRSSADLRSLARRDEVLHDNVEDNFDDDDDDDDDEDDEEDDELSGNSDDEGLMRLYTRSYVSDDARDLPQTPSRDASRVTSPRRPSSRRPSESEFDEDRESDVDEEEDEDRENDNIRMVLHRAGRQKR